MNVLRTNLSTAYRTGTVLIRLMVGAVFLTEGLQKFLLPGGSWLAWVIAAAAAVLALRFKVNAAWIVLGGSSSRVDALSMGDEVLLGRT